MVLVAVEISDVSVAVYLGKVLIDRSATEVWIAERWVHTLIARLSRVGGIFTAHFARYHLLLSPWLV